MSDRRSTIALLADCAQDGPVCHGYANCCRCPTCRRRSENLPRRLSTRKDVRAEIAILRELDFTYSGTNSAGHPCFEHDGYGEITLPSTPRSPHWRKRHRHRLARMLGLSSWQLERYLAGQPLQAVRREPKPKRRPNEEIVMEHVLSHGIPCDKALASRLIKRYGNTRNACRAVDGMARAAKRLNG